MEEEVASWTSHEEKFRLLQGSLLAIRHHIDRLVSERSSQIASNVSSTPSSQSNGNEPAILLASLRKSHRDVQLSIDDIFTRCNVTKKAEVDRLVLTRSNFEYEEDHIRRQIASSRNFQCVSSHLFNWITC